MKSLYPYQHIPDNISLSEFILNKIYTYGDRVAWINAETGRNITYREYGHFVTSLGAALTQEGIGRGDVVMTLTPNCIEHPIVLLSVISLGAIVTPCYALSTSDEMRVRLEDADVSYVFTTQHLLPVLRKALTSANKVKRVFTVEASDVASDCTYTSLWSLVANGEQLLLSDGYKHPHVSFNSKDTLAVLPYSSGTTGRPKGVMLTHHNFIANLVQASYYEIAIDRTPGCVALAFLPFAHLFGVFNLELFGSYRGDTTVVMERYDLEAVLQCIQKYKVTFIPMVPPVALQLLKTPLVSEFDLTSLQFILCGAAPFGPASIQALKLKLDVEVFQCYGLTETCCISHVSPLSVSRDTSAGVLTLLPNIEAKIMDPTSLRELTVGEKGELWIRGDSIMKGYWKNPKATADSLVTGGWLRTGDICFYDTDGAFNIIDRLKELIKYKGYQVAPAVLEDLLLSHNSVEDAAVIGIADDMAGEIPRAYVVIKRGYLLEAVDIHNLVEEKLAAHYKLRGGVEFVASIPKSPSGKILKRQLRDAAERQIRAISPRL